MSGQAIPPGLRLRRTLFDRLDAVGSETATIRRLLKDLNRPGLGRTFNDLQSILASGDRVLADHAAGTSTNIADDLAALLSATQAVEVSPIDPETGEESYNLQQLDNAQSRLVRALLRALEAARAVGVVPTELALPGGDALVVPRSGNEDLLRDIASNLDRVASRLEALEAAKADAVFQQGNFIAFYIGRMNVQIDLAKLQLKVGEHTIDFAALARTGTAMAELTADFFATITAWAGQVSERISNAARTVRRVVVDASRGLVQAIRTVLVRRSREVSIAEAEPPAQQESPLDFDIEQATTMILEGKVPPTTWWPHIIRLDLSGSLGERRQFSDLTPLQTLTKLQELYCANTQVSDLAPLQALTNLQRLYCDNTQVSDLAPLQALTNLQTLSCDNTQVSDLAPLQALTNLQLLVCNNTQVSDLAPLQALTNLQRLVCDNTQVSDLAPLQALTNLQTLSCDNTQVSDLAPLQALTNLQTLSCDDTQVSDLAPLQALTNLQLLYCNNTQVSDLAPLHALTNLQWLYCNNTQVSDLAPLQALTNLQTLDCNNTKVTDVSVLKHLTNLMISGGPERPGAVSGVIRRSRRFVGRILGQPKK